MKSTEDLFQESIKQYQVLTQKATFLSDHMTAMAPDEILKKCDHLNALQTKQIEIDKFIVEIMKDTGPEILEKPYIGEYQRQLDKAMQASSKVAAKAQTIRTLLQAEMNKLKKGQQCLAGYGTSEQSKSQKILGNY